MSNLDNAYTRLTQMVSKRIESNAPFRATVVGTAGNLTEIQRLTATTADAEKYAKVTADTFTAGDEVICLPLNGKPVIIGKVRR